MCWTRRRRGFALQAIHLLDHQEDDEGQDDEIDQDGDEAAVGEDRDAGLLDCFERHRGAVGHLAQRDEQVAEVETADQEADGRHDDVVDQVLDDGA